MNKGLTKTLAAFKGYIKALHKVFIIKTFLIANSTKGMKAFKNSFCA